MDQAKHPDRTLFNLIVLAILILIFIAVAAKMIWELRIAAERTGVQQTLGSLRSATGLKLSEVVIREGIEALWPLHLSNPMLLWTPPPNNYLGEFDGAPAQPAKGAWYFDRSQSMLVYHVRFTDYLINSNSAAPELLRFQLKLSYHDSNNNGMYDQDSDYPTALSLVAMDSYRWISTDDNSGE